MVLSCTNAYGPQKTVTNVRKNSFWNYLGEEAKKVQTSGKGFLLKGGLVW